MAILIDLITPSNPTFSVTLNRDTEQVPCSYKYQFTDTTTINLSQFDRGRVCYELEGEEIGCSTKGGTVIYDFCSPGEYTIRQILTIREIPNCGGASPIIYQEDATFVITVLEWKPTFDFEKIDCCYELDKQVSFYPSEINLNQNVCPVGYVPTGTGYAAGLYNDDLYAVYNPESQKLIYKLFFFNIDTGLYEELGSFERSYGVVNTNPQSYPFSFIPEKLGIYKLTSKLTNCCTSVEDEITFNICDSVIVDRPCSDIPECEDCNTFEIKNLSLSEITVTIKDVVSGTLIHTLTVPSLTKETHTFTEDGVYELNWGSSSMIASVFCSIDECRIKLLKEFLCDNEKDICKFNQLVMVRELFETYQKLVEPYVDTDIRYTSLDIANNLSDFQKLDEIKNQLLEVCDICKNNCSSCFDWDSGTCL